MTSEKARFNKLSPRERQVYELIQQGMSQKEMATILNISPRTINAFVTSIRRKTRQASTGLVIYTAAALKCMEIAAACGSPETVKGIQDAFGLPA